MARCYDRSRIKSVVQIGDAVEFRDLLRRYRAAASLTQGELAARANLSERAVSDLERGARRAPHRDTVLRLADSLGLEQAARTALLTASRRRPEGRGEPKPTIGLPLPLNSFVGRDRELAEVRKMLATARLLTLTGPGGIGKTRLALHLCAELMDDYSGDISLVELGPVPEPGQVPHAVAAALGVPARTGSSLVETLISHFRDRRPLLVLDNCEHVVAAVAEMVEALLRAASGMRVLATSREPLGINGEAVWPVLPLSLGLTRPIDGPSDAARLFLERSRAIHPGFALSDEPRGTVELICRRLDGIPLALELAAAWAAALTPEQVFARIEASPRFLVGSSRTAPPRHHTMDAAIRWSYDLLSDPERRLFMRLSVFAGGFTVEAAEAVGANQAADDTVLSLRQLIAKSLVVAEPATPGGMRYRLLEPLRDFGAELLRDQPDAHVVRDRHGAFFVELVRRSNRIISGGPAAVWNMQLLAEYDNLNTALRWFLETGDVERAQLAGAALAQIWRRRGHVGEGRALLARLMALPRSAEPSVARASLLMSAGQAAHAQGDLTTARAMFAECAAACRQLGDPLGTGFAVSALSAVERDRGALARARTLAEQGLMDLGESGNPDASALLTESLAQVLYAAGDVEQACSLIETSLPTLRAHGWMRRLAGGLQIMAEGAARRGDRVTAHRLLEEALAQFGQLSGPWGAVRVRIELARLEADGSDARAAHDCLAALLSQCRETGDRSGIAAGLEIGAVLAASVNHDERAARLAGAAAVLREAIQVLAAPREKMWLSHRLDAARRRLGQAKYARVYVQGGSLSPEAAVELALQHAKSASKGNLTAREQEIALLVARGCTDGQIALHLVIGRRTVESHVSHILAKLGFDSRAQIAAWATAERIQHP